MTSKNLRRGLAVLATTFVCVASMASPASAATLSGTITDGSLTLHNSTSTVTETLSSSTGGSGSGTGCGTTGSFELTSTTARVLTISSTVRFKLGTGHHVAVLTLLASTSGTLTGVTTTSANFSSSTVTLRAELYTATNTSSTATDCTHGTTRTCRYTATLHISGTYTGNEASPAISDTAVVNSTPAAITVTPPCAAPFSTYIGGTAAVSGLTIHVTSVT
jgi:hypothetical protein